MTINVKFGKIIRKLRETKGLSQEKFALLIGMDRSYYATVESGKHNITLSKIEIIARGLNISIKDIFVMVDNYDFE